MANKPRPGAIRKNKKGPTVGTGGHGRKALAGRGATPKAEDRPYHKAYRAKQLAERSAAKRGAGNTQGKGTRGKSMELVTGRNSVVEALREGVPAKALYLAGRLESDDRVKESMKIAAERGIPLMEIQRPELDRLSNDAVHQGIALHIPDYEYADPQDIAEEAIENWNKGYTRTPPLLVLLDGITDPRNLGAIIRSVSAFNGTAVILPERRSTGMTASAWKTSAGAAARVPVARATNLNTTIKNLKADGYFVIGLDGDGDIALTELTLGKEPLAVVVGSEGKGLSRLVRESCDSIVSIPISSAMESLNASMAVGITLYEIARQRNR